MKGPKIYFNNYITDKWLPEDLRHRERTPKTYEMAYKNCYQTIKYGDVVSKKTLRKWFGIGESVIPKREQIIRLAFAAHFTLDTLQDYLREGLLEPELQLNDYREMIFMYGLEQGCSYQDCLDMITVFERHVNQDTVILQKTHTKKLKEYYNASRLYKREEFLAWMCGHAEYFKGYSRVALKHYIGLKEEVLKYESEDARRRLIDILKKYNFSEWMKENNLKTAEKEDFQRFIKNLLRRKKGNINAEDKKEIRKLMRKAFIQKQKNIYLLRAIDPESENPKTVKSKKKRSFFRMDKKTLSQLQGVEGHKEREIKFSWALSCLDGIEDKSASCPEWICAMMAHYALPSVKTVGAARESLGKHLKNQRQCCHIIIRNDLLPLIHYVAQARYDTESGNGEYNQQKAMDVFIKLANEILSDCQMEKLNQKYYMDCILLSSYKETEMSPFAELIEELEED